MFHLSAFPNLANSSTKSTTTSSNICRLRTAPGSPKNVSSSFTSVFWILSSTSIFLILSHRLSFQVVEKSAQGRIPKINERGYWYTLWIQGALPLTQPLLKYFDQKSYREWYGTSENWVKMSKFTCFLSFLFIKWLKMYKKHVNFLILTQFWDVPYHSR